MEARISHKQPDRISPEAVVIMDHATDSFKHVLGLAWEEAVRLNHPRIGTEHLLLGLLKDPNTSELFRTLGLNLETIKDTVEFITGNGTYPVNEDEICLSPRARNVARLSLVEMERMKDKELSAEHLILGIVQEGQGIAAGALQSLGISLEEVRQTTLTIRQKK